MRRKVESAGYDHYRKIRYNHVVMKHLNRYLSGMISLTVYSFIHSYFIHTYLTVYYNKLLTIVRAGKKRKNEQSKNMKLHFLGESVLWPMEQSFGKNVLLSFVINNFFLLMQ